MNSSLVNEFIKFQNATYSGFALEVNVFDVINLKADGISWSISYLPQIDNASGILLSYGKNNFFG